MTEHDTHYKLLFSDPNITRSLLADFLPPEWLGPLNLDSLEKMGGSYVTDDVRHRHNDMVWRLRCGEDWLYLYLLLEFQSSVDRMMALRVTTYTCLLHQDLVRSKKLEKKPGGTHCLPAVLPVVLYNGVPRWQAPVALAELIEPPPPGLEHFQPNQEFLLIDEGAFDPDELNPANSLAAGIFRLEHHRSVPEVAELMKALAARLNQPDMAETRRTITLWLNHRFGPQGAGLATSEFTNLLEGSEMIRNVAEEWKQQHHQAGLAQGEQTVLLRLLHRRFGELSEVTRQRLESASTDELETWADRVLDAKTLAEVFG